MSDDAWEALREIMREQGEDPKCNAGEDCVCCGLRWFNEKAACGHWYCSICLGRGHDEDCETCHPPKEAP